MAILERLSPRAELVLINLITFGPFAAISIYGLVHRQSTIIWDDRRLYTIVGLELVCAAIAIPLLRARGWKLSDFNVRFSMPQTIAGMILFIIANVAISSFYRLFTLLTHTDPGSVTTFVARASWPAIILLLAVDPIYEETFEVAYNLRATEKDGPAFGITLSAAVRLLCHAYQGPIAPMTILPLGIIFGLVYWKWRRVWPLAVAHGVAQFWGLAPVG